MKIVGVDQGALANLDNRTAPASVQGNKSSANIAGDNTNKDGKDVRDDQQYSPEQLKKSVDTLNNTMKTYNTELKFELHEKSGEFMIKVLKESDGSVIREIPPKRVLDMVAHFKELLGIMVDKMF